MIGIPSCVAVCGSPLGSDSSNSNDDDENATRKSSASTRPSMRPFPSYRLPSPPVSYPAAATRTTQTMSAEEYCVKIRQALPFIEGLSATLRSSTAGSTRGFIAEVSTNLNLRRTRGMRFYDEVHLDSVEALNNVINCFGDMLLANSPSLSTVAIDDRTEAVPAADYERFSQGLSHNPYVRCVNLASLPDQAMPSLLMALATNLHGDRARLRDIRLRGMNLRGESFRRFCQNIPNDCRLSTLRLDGCSYTGSLSSVWELLQMNTSVHYLRILNPVDLGDIGADALQQGLSQNTVLQHLYLNRFNFRSDPRLSMALGRGLGINASLTELEFYECRLKGAQIRALFDSGLYRNTTLESIQLDRNEIDDHDGMIALVEGLEKMAAFIAGRPIPGVPESTEATGAVSNAGTGTTQRRESSLRRLSVFQNYGLTHIGDNMLIQCLARLHLDLRIEQFSYGNTGRDRRSNQTQLADLIRQSSCLNWVFVRGYEFTRDEDFKTLIGPMLHNRVCTSIITGSGGTNDHFRTYDPVGGRHRFHLHLLLERNKRRLWEFGDERAERYIPIALARMLQTSAPPAHEEEPARSRWFADKSMAYDIIRGNPSLFSSATDVVMMDED